MQTNLADNIKWVHDELTKQHARNMDRAVQEFNEARENEQEQAKSLKLTREQTLEVIVAKIAEEPSAETMQNTIRYILKELFILQDRVSFLMRKQMERNNPYFAQS
jgi:hypothetical protein